MLSAVATDGPYEVYEVIANDLHGTVKVKMRPITPPMVNGPDLWDHILKQLPKGSVIAGGAIRDYLLHLPPKDIDVFYSHKKAKGLDEAWDHARRSGFFTIPGNDEHKEEYEALERIHTVTRKPNVAGFQVDFVILNDGRTTGKSVIKDFDFGIARGYYDGELFISREMLRDLQHQTVTLMIQDRREQSMKRFERFNHRMGGNYHLKELSEWTTRAKPSTPKTPKAKPASGGLVSMDMENIELKTAFETARLNSLSGQFVVPKTLAVQMKQPLSAKP